MGGGLRACGKMALTAGDNNENPLQMTYPVSLCYGNSSKMLYILSFERRRAQAFFSEFSSNFFHLQTQHQHRSRCGGDTPAQRNVTHI